MIKIKPSGRFNLMYRDLVKNDPELLDLVADAIRVFEKNPDDTRLRNHALKKSMKGRWAFSITSDIRIVYRWVGKNVVRFLAIGPHRKVYKKS